MAKAKAIISHKGVLHFPSLEAVQAFAAHLGLTGARFSSGLKGWSIRPTAKGK